MSPLDTDCDERFAQATERAFEAAGTKHLFCRCLVPLPDERSENVPEVIVQIAQCNTYPAGGFTLGIIFRLSFVYCGGGPWAGGWGS